MIEIAIPALPLLSMTAVTLFFLVFSCLLIGGLAYVLYLDGSSHMTVFLIIILAFIIFAAISNPDAGIQLINITVMK